MRSTYIYASVLSLAALSSSRLLPDQRPLLKNPLGNLPTMKPSSNDVSTPVQPAVPLEDILGANRALTTFSSLARMHSSTSSLLSDLTTNTTVLAPLNSAVDALPRKPWEAPDENGRVESFEGKDGEEKARENLRRFVEAHLVVGSPWVDGERKGTVGGGEVWWEERNVDGERRRVVLPDGVVVEKVASVVANGELWLLRGVLNYV